MSTSELSSTAVRGALAAMAMTGMRRMTKELGLLRREPPEAVVEEGLPGLAARIPSERRDAAIELGHWLYGAAGGAGFALLPEWLRRRALAGPVYGLAHWSLFEAGLAPLLGIRWPKQRGVAERAAVIGDHLVYGLVVGGSPAGELGRVTRTARSAGAA